MICLCILLISCFFSYLYQSFQQWRLGLWKRSWVFLTDLVHDVLFVFSSFRVCLGETVNLLGLATNNFSLEINLKYYV